MNKPQNDDAQMDGNINSNLPIRYKILLFCAVYSILSWIVIGVFEICHGDMESGMFHLCLILPAPLMLITLKKPKLPLAVPITVFGGFMAVLLTLMSVTMISELGGRDNDIFYAIGILFGFASVWTGIWGGVTAYRFIKERMLAEYTEEDWTSTTEVGSIMIRHAGLTRIVDTRESKIIEISRSSWDFITEPDLPDFASKFENLIKAYLNNAYLDEKRFPGRKEIVFFLELIQPDNWLCKLPLRVPVLTCLKKDTGKVEEIRLSALWHYLEAINMIQDYYRFFGKSDSSLKTFAQAYVMLLKAPQKGFEAEKKQWGKRDRS